MMACRWLAALALTVLMTGCEAPPPPSGLDGTEDVGIPPVELPRARMPPGPIPAAFKLPAGKPPAGNLPVGQPSTGGPAGGKLRAAMGPFPAIIVLHGCGGRGAGLLLWEQRLNDWGYAVLMPDSMTPRGVKRVCEPVEQSLVTPRDRVGDIASAVAWLRAQPNIDPARIAVLGLSHGGATAVMATDRIYDGLRLRAAVDYYGPCVDPAAHGDVPLLVLAGAEDDWGHPAARCEAYGLALQPGQIFEIHSYPGVYHAFENPMVKRVVSNTHIMEYNEAAAEDSFVRLHAFLDRWVMR